ncbi:MAG TPA: SMP-30/gluconolactonase/LRE family protein, partial [Steroidobacteraceae bacterium]|nr:SMP-30/gluconolactonase/LRE family protein [Steroidobacteraceae bacterium]
MRLAAGFALRLVPLALASSAAVRAQQAPLAPAATPAAPPAAGAAPYVPVAGLRAGERTAEVRGIPGVVAANAQWELVWADFETADGIIPTADGGVMFAQEQTDTIRKLGADNREYVVLRDTHATGSISLDAQGRLFGVQRTCTDSARPFYQSCQELTYVAQLLPEHRVLANSFADGKPFGRLNDVMADGKGGAYFTVGGAYHVSASGVVTVVENQNLVSNGILLSADGRTLWVTNSDRVIAFDVQADGSTKNRRDFGLLDGDRGADGMAIDSEGRLYVTASKGVHVLGRDGKYIGLIPTPRAPITLT